MEDNKCALQMQNLLFDKIEFKRKGIKNDNQLKLNFQVQYASSEEIYRVTVVLDGIKDDEYEFHVELSGFFTISCDGNVSEEIKNTLIEKNTVAIMMPFLRSEVSLLTAQPEVDCVVLPPFNINALMDVENKK